MGGVSQAERRGGDGSLSATLPLTTLRCVHAIIMQKRVGESGGELWCRQVCGTLTLPSLPLSLYSSLAPYLLLLPFFFPPPPLSLSSALTLTSPAPPPLWVFIIVNFLILVLA